jgi:hypothetical protein
MKRIDILKESVKKEESINFNRIKENDEFSIEKLMFDNKSKLRQVNLSIEDFLKNPKNTIDSQFLALYKEKLGLDFEESILNTLKESYI